MLIFSFDLGETHLAYAGVNFTPDNKIENIPYASNQNLNDYSNRCIRCSQRSFYVHSVTGESYCARHCKSTDECFICRLKTPEIKIQVFNMLDTIKHLFFDNKFHYTIYEAPYRNVEWQKHIADAIVTWFYINKIPTKLMIFDARRKMKYLPLNTHVMESRRYAQTKKDTKEFVFQHLRETKNEDLLQFFEEYEKNNGVRIIDMIDAIFNAYIFANEK